MAWSMHLSAVFQIEQYMTLKVKVLEYANKTFKGKDGSDIPFSQAVVRTEEGKMMRLSVAQGNDLTPYLDKDVVLEVSVFPDFQMNPKVRVSGIVPAK